MYRRRRCKLASSHASHYMPDRIQNDRNRMKPFPRSTQKDRGTRLPSDNDLADRGQRRRAFWANQFLDHAILRHVWSNFDQIAPGVYRSNQPGHWRLKRYAKMGIHTNSIPARLIREMGLPFRARKP